MYHFKWQFLLLICFSNFFLLLCFFKNLLRVAQCICVLSSLLFFFLWYHFFRASHKLPYRTYRLLFISAHYKCVASILNFFSSFHKESCKIKISSISFYITIPIGNIFRMIKQMTKRKIYSYSTFSVIFEFYYIQHFLFSLI